MCYLLTDDFTKYVTVYFLKNKSEVLKIPRIREHGNKCHWFKDPYFTNR